MRSKLIITVLTLSITLGSTACPQIAGDETTFAKCMGIAEQIALRMMPGGAKDQALKQVIFAYARAGVFEPIVAIDNEVLDRHVQIQALLDAVNYSDATKRNKVAAAALSRRALALVAANPKAASRDNLLWQIAGQLTEIGEIAEARDATKLIESLADYDHALYQITQAQAYQDDLVGATATAEAMRPGRWREQAFAVIAGSATRNKDAARANDALTQSRQYNHFALSGMAWEKSRAQDFQAALDLSRQIANQGVQMGAMQKVGEDAAAAGAIDVAGAAFREAHAIARQRELGFALANIASAQAKANLFDDALATVDDLEKLPPRKRALMGGNDVVFALGNMAKAQAGNGHLADARRSLDRARQSLLGGAENSSLVDIVSHAMAIGEIALAREIAKELPVYLRLRALRIIAVGLAKFGDFDGAAETLADIQGQQDRYDFADDARQEIAVEQFRHGRVDGAFETVSQIRSPGTQVMALTEMAAARR